MTNEDFQNRKQAIRKFFKEQGINVQLKQGTGTARMWLTITPTVSKLQHDAPAALKREQKKAAVLLAKYGVGPGGRYPDEIEKSLAADNLKTIDLSPRNTEKLINQLTEQQAVKKSSTQPKNQLRATYNKNEDENRHTENYLLLAKEFGTAAEVKQVMAIIERNEKQGYTSSSDNDWMYKNINPYYRKHLAVTPTKKPAYDQDEVQKLIDRDPSIKPGEAKLIHRLLAGPGHRLVGVEDRISKRNGKRRGLHL